MSKLHVSGEPQVLGGGLEGAKRTTRETVNWNPPLFVSPDSQINPVKEMSDARGRDLICNDGYMTGALHTNRDSIVGSQYMVNSQPNLEVLQQIVSASRKPWVRKLALTDAWMELFQLAVESKFNLLSDASARWLDAAGRNTLTEQVRLAVGTHVMTGEVLATVEWIRQGRRPFNTAVQMVSPSRLSNPDNRADEIGLRNGVELNLWGQPVAYWIRNGFNLDYFNTADSWKWKRVPAEKPWGRRQVIHIVEQFLVSQTRGISEMVAAMKEAKMTKKFQEITLQNAVINASYAAAIETELPREMAFATLGGNQNEFSGDFINDYLVGLMEYMQGAKNIHIDGAKMPVLYPGTKLNLQQIGAPGGIGGNFEESLLRNIAASLGISYEQYSRDFSKTNYSSARASMGETYRRMRSKKKIVADSYANEVYLAWLEEDINAGALPLPEGCSPRTFAAFFYEPLVKEALSTCSWIGASRGQIDELKETQAAVLRIQSGLSTWERESARLGEDWRYIMRQRNRENKMQTQLGLHFSTGSEKPGENTAQQTMKDNQETADVA